MKNDHITKKNFKYPNRLRIEVTNACNLRCEMCARSFSNFQVKHMKWDTFCHIKKYFPKVKEIALFGWGEPTIHPLFEKMLNSVWECGSESYFTTNALQLDKFAKILVDGNQRYLNISLDATEPELYNQIRRGSDFDKVIKNIKLLNKYKKDCRSDEPHIRFTFVAMKKNINNLPDLADLANKLNVHAIKVVYLTAFIPEMRDQILWFKPELIKDSFKKLKEKASKYKIKLDLPPEINPQFKTDVIKHQPCILPWSEMFIDSSGNVRSCDISTEVLGNILKQDLMDIWTDEKYNMLRDTVNSEHPKGECAKCYQCYRLNVHSLDAHIRYDASILQDRKKR